MNSFTCNATALPRSFRLTERPAQTLFDKMVEVSFCEPIFSNQKEIDLRLRLCFGLQYVCVARKNWFRKFDHYIKIGLRSVVLQLELERCSLISGSERSVCVDIGGRKTYLIGALPSKKWLVGKPGFGDPTEPGGPDRLLYHDHYFHSYDRLCRICPDKEATSCKATVTLRADLKDVIFRDATDVMRPLNHHKKFAQQVSEIGKFPGGATHEGFIDLARASATFSLEAPYLPQPTSPAGDLFE